MRAFWEEARLPASVRGPVDLRALARLAARRRAEADCSAHEIMSITGHRNLKEVETYVQAVNERSLAKAAIAKRAKGA